MSSPYTLSLIALISLLGFTRKKQLQLKLKGRAQGISADGNREKNGRKNGNHSKTSGSRQRKLEHCQSKILLLFTVFLKYYISLQIQFGILLFSRQNMHYLTLISELVVCRLSLIANKQEFVKKNTFCCFNFGNSEKGQKLDGKAEIEEKIY